MFENALTSPAVWLLAGTLEDHQGLETASEQASCIHLPVCVCADTTLTIMLHCGNGLIC